MSHVRKKLLFVFNLNESVSQKGLLSNELRWWIEQIFSGNLNIVRAWRTINGTHLANNTCTLTLNCPSPSLFGSCYHAGVNKTVHSPLFFRKIIEIERFALQAAILHECQNNSGHLKIKIAVTVRRSISKRSHEKIGDCEQSRDERDQIDW